MQTRLIFAALFLVSIALNIFQWRADIVEDTKAEGATELANVSAEAQQLTDAIAKIKAMQGQKAKDDAALAQLKLDLAAAQGKTEIQFVDRWHTIKVKPVCEINPQQVDAINEALK